MNRTVKAYQIVAGCLALFCMLLIFFFSHQPGDDSTKTSSAFSRGIVTLADNVLDMNLSSQERIEAAERIENIVRKLAHMTEFGILAGFIYLALDFDTFSCKKHIFWSMILSVGYAASDELHQRFVPGRCAKVTDVVIDSAGAILTIVFILGVKRCISSLSNRHK